MTIKLNTKLINILRIAILKLYFDENSGFQYSQRGINVKCVLG